MWLWLTEWVSENISSRGAYAPKNCPKYRNLKILSHLAKKMVIDTKISVIRPNVKILRSSFFANILILTIQTDYKIKLVGSRRSPVCHKWITLNFKFNKCMSVWYPTCIYLSHNRNILWTLNFKQSNIISVNSSSVWSWSYSLPLVTSDKETKYSSI